MKKSLPVMLACTLFLSNSYAQNRYSKDEFIINGFRNPSIGLEYRYRQVSIHGGYYITAFKAGETTSFWKAGVLMWFLPVSDQPVPSSFFAGLSYLHGLSRDYDGKEAIGIEGGFRWTIWKGLNLRIGAIALAADGESLKLNPAPGISYSF